MAGYVWEKSYPPGVKWDIEIPRKGLHDILAESAGAFGDKPLIDFFDKVLSFREVEALANRAAAGLQKLGVGPGLRGARAQLGSDGLPVHAVHRDVEVRVADDGPRLVERLERAGGLRIQHRAGGDQHGSEQQPAIHLMRALICSGGSKTDGSTLSKTTDWTTMTC